MSDKALANRLGEAVEYVQSSNLLDDAELIINSARTVSKNVVNATLLQRNWLLGKRIHEEQLNGASRAEYGKQVIAELSEHLTAAYGRGFEQRTLYRFVQFYKEYPDILTTLLSKSAPMLTWSHYLVLLRVDDARARKWYEKEAFEQGWSVRTLDRNVSTLYYDRLLLSTDKDSVCEEMREKTSEYQQNRLEFIKNPVIAEFLGIPQDKSFLESELESAIITNLSEFLMELGKGYAFVARQQHIDADGEDYYIDLVFYNYLLKCFVLIDLKTSKITHQDIGQMDMYVRMYDDLRRGEDDNPTLGIVLCTETSETIARYSVLHDNDHLFAAKYKLCLPSEDELRAEIENQKLIFASQHEGKDAR